MFVVTLFTLQKMGAKLHKGRTPLIPTLGRHRQMGLFEFEASLDYTSNSRMARQHQETLSPKKKIIIIR